jgi:hypothetical protein
MCGVGDERWWGANADAQAKHKPAKMALADDSRPPAQPSPWTLPWVERLVTWALAEDDSTPLDLDGVETPPRIAMLLGRAFSDVAELVGQRVLVYAAATMGAADTEEQVRWSGDVSAVHRDATGAPYALQLGQWRTIPWHAVGLVQRLPFDPDPDAPF